MSLEAERQKQRWSGLFWGSLILEVNGSQKVVGGCCFLKPATPNPCNTGQGRVWGQESLWWHRQTPFKAFRSPILAWLSKDPAAWGRCSDVKRCFFSLFKLYTSNLDCSVSAFKVLNYHNLWGSHLATTISDYYLPCVMQSTDNITSYPLARLLGSYRQVSFLMCPGTTAACVGGGIEPRAFCPSRGKAKFREALPFHKDYQFVCWKSFEMPGSHGNSKHSGRESALDLEPSEKQRPPGGQHPVPGSLSYPGRPRLLILPGSLVGSCASWPL